MLSSRERIQIHIRTTELRIYGITLVSHHNIQL